VVKVLMAQHFLEGFVPIGALYAIMFGTVGGLDFTHIGWLFAIWSVAYLVAELPSGVLADYWSRKYVIMLGGVIRTAGFLIWMVWPGFWGYAIGFALWGIMIACSSGAVAAYLHTELRAINMGEKYAKYYGWVTSFLWVGVLCGSVTAAIFTLKHTNLLIGLSAASSLLFTVLLVGLPEHPYKKQATYLKTLAAGAQEVFRSQRLRYICLVLFSVYMIIGVIEELLPRLYANFGLNDTAVSLTLAASVVATVLLVARLETIVRFSLFKQGLVMALGVLFLLGGLYAGGLWGVGLLMLFSLLFHVFRPVFIHHAQEATKGEERATIGSIPGLAAGLFGAGAYALIGVVAGFTSERMSIALYGAVWLVVVLALAVMGRRYDAPS
jgi:MFS family permease